MDLLLIFDENTSHYVYIKDFNRLLFIKTKHKNKKYFCRCCLQCFTSEKSKQNVKLGKSSMGFKNYSKLLPAPFKFYPDCECILCSTLSKKFCQEHISCSFACKVVCVDNKFSKDVGCS